MKKQDTPAARLKLILERVRMNQSQFATALSITPQSINQVLQGRKKISAMLAEKISNMFDVDFEWLLTGKESLENVATRTKPQEARKRRIPKFYCLPAVRNPAFLTQKETPESAIFTYCSIPRGRYVEPTRLRCLQIWDDSMEPMLPKGAIVAVDPYITDPKDLHAKLMCAKLPDGETCLGFWYNQTTGGSVFLDPKQSKIVAFGPDKKDDAIVGMVVWASIDYAPKSRPHLKKPGKLLIWP